MAQLQAVFYRAPDGSEPVDGFIEALADPDRQAAIDFQIDRPEDRRSANLVILLHMFRKDTGRLPPREVEIAKERWADFKARMDAAKRVPPRAAGHDAP
jgi:hypothetical protein